nr:MAG TPA: hypothetical protein [Caudoviricetes sp.]
MKREMVAEAQSINYETGLIILGTCYKDEGYREPFYTVNIEEFYDGREEFGRFHVHEFDEKQQALDYMTDRIRL